MARAAPLSAEQRRAAIVAAAERLIVNQGAEVSTRAIAEEAGIAEGTIFRVFPTKEAIIDAIFADAFDHEGFRHEIAGIDMDTDLRARMTAIVAIVQKRSLRVMALFGALGFRKPAGVSGSTIARRQHLSVTEIAAILEPDGAQLSLPPIDAARMLQAMVMALANPLLGNHTDLGPESIVDLILNGISRRPKREQVHADDPR